MSDLPTVSARQLNRATLERQLLLRRERLSPVDAVARVVCLQAQEAASPYIGLWNRVEGFDAAEMDVALADHALVKASLMRVTLHIVTADDYPSFHEAMQRTLRAARFHDDRFKVAGLTVAEVEALLPELIEFTAEPRSNSEMERWLDERHGRVLERPGVWWAMRQVGPFVHAPVGGPWSFGPRPAYTAARRQERARDWEASTRILIKRYLAGFGPASLADFCQFAFMPRGWARPVWESLAGELVRLEGPAGEQLYDLPGATLPDEATPVPPRLLPMWDSILLVYADRRRVMPEEYRKSITRSNGDTLPTLLVDGQVAGVWRPTEEGIETTAFRPLSDDEWAGLEEEAGALRGFLAAREPKVYKRYARWWDRLPAGEVRRLA